MSSSNIDLGSSKELITLVYGDGSSTVKYAPITPPASNVSAANSAGSSLAKRQKKKKDEEQRAKLAEENRRNQKQAKKSGGGGCSAALCAFLFLIALGAIVAAAVIGHLVALQNLAPMDSGPRGEKLAKMRYNMTFAEDGEESADDSVGATGIEAAEIAAEERHLPDALEPIGYKLNLKVFIPGHESPAEKSSTYEATVDVKLRVKEDTDKIELHAEGLEFNSNDLSAYKLLTAGGQRRLKREEEHHHHGHHHHHEGNATEAPVEEEMTTEAVAEEPETTTIMEEENTTTQATSTEATTMAEETTTAEATTHHEHRMHVAKKVDSLVDSGLKISGVTVDKDRLKVIFALEKPLTAGSEITLRIPFSGPLRDSLNGMFLTQYKDSTGNRKYVAMTHFEPQYARRFVPCFDEPRYKATWAVQVTHPSKMSASSNGVIESESEEGGWRTSVFKETPPMSSYLLAIVVSEFASHEKISESGKTVRLWARPENLKETKLALDAAVKVLDHFEKFYEIPFPLEKQDIYALPRFEAGAMENWGLLMFREERLLYSEKVQSIDDKMKVLKTVAHELSHQWFGDLVTISWWNDLWLNEGLAVHFASDGAGLATDGALKTKEYTDFLDMDEALLIDAKATSHPISYKVEQPREIASLFDLITYSKGAVVTRMLQGVLGNDAFKSGIKNYLKSHIYGSATSKELFASFDEVVPEALKAWDGSKLNVNAFASNWILQMGYPVVNVRRVTENLVELTQTRFKSSNVTEEKNEFRNAKFWYKWDLPLWHSIDGEQKPMTWLHEALRLNLTASQLLLVNQESIGFYRVNYDAAGWTNIVKTLREDHNRITPAGRARLISDSFALASAGDLPYAVPFAVTSYLEKETELIPLAASFREYHILLEYFRDRPDGEDARNFITRRVLPIYQRVDWSTLGSSSDAQYDQSVSNYRILAFACRWSIGDCQSKMAALFESGLVSSCPDDGASRASNCSSVAPLIRGVAYCQGMARAHPAIVKRVQRLIERETNHREKSRLVESLGCSRDTRVLKTLFADTLLNGSSNGVDFLAALLGSLSQNTVVDYVLQDYVVENWRKITKSLGEHQFSVDKVIKTLPVHNDRKLAQLEAFMDARKASTSKFGSFDAVIEAMKNEKDWRWRHHSELDRIFNPKPEAAAKKPKADL